MLVQDVEFFPEDYPSRNPNCLTGRATELHAEMQRMHDGDTHDDDLIAEDFALNAHTEQHQKAVKRETSQLLSRSPTASAQEGSALNTSIQMPQDITELAHSRPHAKTLFDLGVSSSTASSITIALVASFDAMQGGTRFSAAELKEAQTDAKCE